MSILEKYYEPKYLFGVLKKTEPVNLYFRKNFFGETFTYTSESVTFEFMKSGRGLARAMNEDMPAPVIGRKGYKAQKFTPPFIGGSRVITRRTLESKLPGESEYNSGLSPEDRAAQIVANDLEELQAAIQRKEEYMCARVKQDGKLIFQDEGVNNEIDYGFKNIEVCASSDKWTSNYDILGKLREMNRKLLETGNNPDMLIMGYQAAAALMENTKIAKLLDNRRLNFGDIAPEKLQGGVQYLGRLLAVGLYLDLYCYADFYYDWDHGTVMPYMDTDAVIMQSSGERNLMLYGAVSYIDANQQEVSVTGEYVPYIAVSYDPPVKKLIVASRPLPMPRDIDSWAVLKAVV